VVAEVSGGVVPAPRRRRSLTEVLVEVGIYVGSALVLAAAVVMVAQSWEGFADLTRIAILAATTLLAGLAGVVVSRGAGPGSPRRRLAGVLLAVAAAAAGGTVGLAVGDTEFSAILALAAALAVLVAGQALAASAVTEIGLVAVSFALLSAIGAWLTPEGTETLDEYGEYVYEASTFEQLMPLGSVAFGLLWGLVVARWLTHRELAVALGVLIALSSALPLAAESQTRVIGLTALAAIAAIGLWRFLTGGYWPWLAGTIGAVTAFVFFAVGGAHRSALAFLVAGLVLLASSGGGLVLARRRRAAGTSPPAPSEVARGA
jgi:hypothetical protein